MSLRALFRWALRGLARILLVRRKIAYVANVNDLRYSSARTPVSFRFGDRGDLESFTVDIHNYDLDAKRYGRERLQSGDKLILGEIDGKVVFYGWVMFGSLDLGVRTLLPVGSDAVASYRLFTVADQRGKKISAAYFFFLKEEAQKLGCRRIVSWVEARNRPSARMHERAGFHRIGNIFHLRILGASCFWISPRTRARLQGNQRIPHQYSLSPHPVRER
jgi:GNAT superfamily N-acetyltransferase